MRYVRVKNFDLKTTLDCGQTFSWIREGEGYVNADIGQVVYIEQHDDRLYYETSSGPANLKDLLRLDDPIDEINSELLKDDLMRESIEYSDGMRIISDPFYTCLVSFLLSTWSNIPRIRKHMRDIREIYGPTYDFRGKIYYGMPAPEILGEVDVKELKQLGLAWRAEFISQSTKKITSGEISKEELVELDYEAAHKRLQMLHGVGTKVADCVCLFTLGFLEAFPIDVWIERVIQQHYGLFTELGRSYAKKSQAARNYFGRYAGYAQEYLYHYTRSSNKKWKS
jgi:N-glycosylase/DNA lyase